jgi:hypothetical protein
MLTTEGLQGRLPALEPLRLSKVIGQCHVGPVCPLQPAGGWAVEYPLAEEGGYSGGEPRGGPLGLAGLQALQAPVTVGVEPVLYRPWGRASVLCNRRVAPASIGHEDNLHLVAECGIRRGPEDLFQALDRSVSQMDADHSSVLSKMRQFSYS